MFETSGSSVGARDRRGLSLRENFSWTLAGNLVFGLCQWAMLVVLAKTVSVDAVGRFALALAVTAPVIMCSRMDLRSVNATDARGEYAFGEYLALRLVMTGAALVVIAGIAGYAYGATATAVVIVWIGFAKAMESVSDVTYGLLQRHERMDHIGKSVMLRGVCSLLALSVAVWLTGDVAWAAFAMAAAWLGTLLLYDVPGTVRIVGVTESDAAPAAVPQAPSLMRPVWSGARLLWLARLAAPLAVVMLLVSLSLNIPRYAIERYMGEAQLGFFAAMAYLIVAGNMIVNALGHAAVPRLASLYQGGNRRAYRRLLIRLVGLGAVLGLAGVVGAAVAGEWALSVLYTPEYAAYSGVLVWLMVAATFGFAGILLGHGITATRAFDRFLLPYAIVGLVALAASAFLVPAYGLTGAAWAVCIVGIGNCIMPLLILGSLERRAPRPRSAGAAMAVGASGESV